MKVVLREDLDNLGERGEIVNVARGYARNYLLPKGLALEATPGNMKVIEQQRKIWAVRDAKARDEAQAVADRIGKIVLTVRKKAGESQTLYGSVTNSELGEMLEGEGVTVDRRKIVLDEPIKTLGEFEVSVKIHKDVIGRFKLKVEPEEE